MAITILGQPATHSPIYNPNKWSVSSNNTSEPLFKYIVEVYVGATRVYFGRLRPEPTTGNELMPEFDVAEVLHPEIGQNIYFPFSVAGILSGNDSFIDYEIRFGEEYEVAGTITQFLNLANDTAIVFNGGFRYPDFVDYDPVDWLDTKFLTNMPRTQTTDLRGLGALHLLLDSGTTVNSLEIETYLGGVSQNLYGVVTSLSPTDYYLFAAGVDSINNIDGSNFAPPVVQPILTSAIDEYRVRIKLNASFTEEFVFKIVDNCREDEPVRVHYLNELGGYDWLDFDLARRDSYTAEAQTMKQQVTNQVSTGALRYSKQDRVNRDYCTTTKRSITVTTNWLTDEQMEQFREMIGSPDIYIEEDGDLVSVNIQNRQILIDQERYDELFNREITFDYAIDQTRQRY